MNLTELKWFFIGLLFYIIQLNLYRTYATPNINLKSDNDTCYDCMNQMFNILCGSHTICLQLNESNLINACFSAKMCIQTHGKQCEDMYDGIICYMMACQDAGKC
jgi:hypothetical protein